MTILYAFKHFCLGLLNSMRPRITFRCYKNGLRIKLTMNYFQPINVIDSIFPYKKKELIFKIEFLIINFENIIKHLEQKCQNKPENLATTKYTLSFQILISLILRFQISLLQISKSKNAKADKFNLNNLPVF